MKPWIKHLLIRVGIVICVFLYILYKASNISCGDDMIGVGLLALFIYGVLFILFTIEAIYLLVTKSMQKFYANLVLILIIILFLSFG